MANSDYTVRTGSNGFCPVGYLTADIGPLDSEVTMSGYTSPIADGIRIGMAAMIQDEIVVVTARTGNDLTLGRGCCDTVPAPHSTGDAIWFFDDSIGTDRLEYAGTATIGVKPLPRVTAGVLPIEHSPPAGLTFNLRFARPYPPGMVEVNGVPWFTTPLVLSLTEPTLELAWAHRDRITQQDQLIDHLETDIGPEAGTTYEIRVYREDGTLLRTVVGITGTTWTYELADAIIDFSAAGDEYPGYMMLCSMRDGLASYQQYRIDFTLASSTEPVATDACGELLLHFDGDFVDSSDNARTVTSHSATRSTDHPAWGPEAFEGGGGWLEIVDDGTFDFGNGVFSIDFQIFIETGATLATDNIIIGKWGAVDGSWFVNLASDGRIFLGRKSGGTYQFDSLTAVAITRNVRQHITVIRPTVGAGVYGMIEGVTSDGDSGATFFDSTSNNIAIGAVVGGGAPLAAGVHIDEMHIAVGAQVTLPLGGFTPPTGPYVCDGGVTIPDTTDVTLTLTASIPAQQAGAAIAMNLTQLAAPISAGSAYVSIFYIPLSLLPDPAPIGRTVSVSFGLGLSQSIAVETVLTYTTTASTSHADIVDSLIAQANAATPLSSRGLSAGANAYTGRPGMQITGPVGLKLHSTYDLMTPGLLAPVFAPVNNILVVEFALGSSIVAVALNQIVTATVSGTPAAGDLFTVTLNGVAFGYTAASGDSVSAVATALAALIDADSNYAASAASAVITIDGVTSTNVFSYAASSVSLFAY